MGETTHNILKDTLIQRGPHKGAIKNPLTAQEEANTILEVVGKATPDGYDIDEIAKKALNKKAQDFVLTAQAEKTVRKDTEAATDLLTGVGSRSALNKYLLRLLEHPRRDTGDLILLVDADHFKKVNDTLGHDAGDEALKKLASLLESNARGKDYVGRYGGEEFVVVMTEVVSMSEGWEARSLERAEILRDKIQRQFKPLVEQATGEKLKFPLTVSIGAIVLKPGDYPEQATEEDVKKIIYKPLDKYLYRAKREGRNRVASPLSDVRKL